MVGEINKEGKVFIKDKHITFKSLYCKNCKSFQDIQGNSEMDMMYYIFLCVKKMTLSEKRIIVVKSPEENFFVAESLAVYLGQQGIGWHLKSRVSVVEDVGEKNPQSTDVWMYEFERLLK